VAATQFFEAASLSGPPFEHWTKKIEEQSAPIRKLVAASPP
jgi:hypothetical protein